MSALASWTQARISGCANFDGSRRHMEMRRRKLVDPAVADGGYNNDRAAEKPTRENRWIQHLDPLCRGDYDKLTRLGANE
jgi:hypothetical protein